MKEVQNDFCIVLMSTPSHLNQHVAALPVDAMVAMQLLTVFRDSDHDIDQVVDFISQHPALAEETLKRCNRLKFHGHGHVTDIFEAVSRLGYYELYSIVSSSLTAQGILHEASAQTAEEQDWNIRF